MAAENPLHVIVLGAGVIGLQTALCLLEAGFKVTVVAKYLPGDLSTEYTSPWAGAHWRTHANTPELMQWDTETFEHWKELVAQEEAAKKEGRDGVDSGVKLYPSFFYWDGPDPEIIHGADSIWWRNVVLNFKVLPPLELPNGVKFGVSYTSFCLNPELYLKYLREKLEEAGTTFIRLALPTESGFAAALAKATETAGDKSPFAVVNATGLGAKSLVGDEDMFPTRGQTLFVRKESPVARLRVGDGYIAYTIPRPGSGGTILGGCKQEGNWDSGVDPELSREIIRRCKVLTLELLDANGEFDILSEQVGFRPSRRGGPRVEIENVPSADGSKSLIVVHSYGHSGAGYQNSIGSARKVARLLQEQK